jgi:hypothetical protein
MCVHHFPKIVLNEYYWLFDKLRHFYVEAGTEFCVFHELPVESAARCSQSGSTLHSPKTDIGKFLFVLPDSGHMRPATINNNGHAEIRIYTIFHVKTLSGAHDRIGFVGMHRHAVIGQ